VLVKVAPEDLPLANQNVTGHLTHVADRLSGEVSTKDGAKPGAPDGGAEESTGAPLVQVKSAIEAPLWIGDGPRLRPATLEEAVSFGNRAQVDEQDGGELLVALHAGVHFLDIAAAERSAEVAQEDQQRRFGAEDVDQPFSGQVSTEHGEREQFRSEEDGVNHGLGEDTSRSMRLPLPLRNERWGSPEAPRHRWSLAPQCGECGRAQLSGMYPVIRMLPYWSPREIGWEQEVWNSISWRRLSSSS
jgi:hypothetical protein